MKRRIVLIVGYFIFLSTSYLLAQGTDHIKHENHFKQVDPIETDKYKIEISNAHAQQQFCQLKLNITNKTNDYIFVNLEEFKFIFDEGTYSPKSRRGIASLLSGQITILPKKSKKFTAKVAEGANFHVEKFDLEINGIYIVSTSGEALKTEKFRLPADKNSFKTGGFKIKLLDLIQRTQGTRAKFACTYVGDKVGLFDPDRLVIITKKGKYANMERVSKVKVMQEKDKTKFIAKFEIEGRILDMQFATMYESCLKRSNMRENRSDGFLQTYPSDWFLNRTHLLYFLFDVKISTIPTQVLRLILKQGYQLFRYIFR